MTITLDQDPVSLKGKDRNEWLKLKQDDLLNKVRNFKNDPKDIEELFKFMTKFHNYSFRNALLIDAQWKGAYAVGSYNLWKKLGYSLKGAKSRIFIWVHVKYRYIDKGKGVTVMWSKATAKDRKLAEEGVYKIVKGETYKAGAVFDISQTDCPIEDYPKIFPNRHYNFEDDKLNYESVLVGIDKIADKLGVELFWDSERRIGNAKGAYFRDKDIILLNPNITKSETVSVSLHELAHACMHKKTDLPKHLKELQAELVASLVSSFYGLNTLEQTVGYLHSYLNSDVHSNGVAGVLDSGVEDVTKDKPHHIDNILIDVQSTVRDFIRIINNETDNK